MGNEHRFTAKDGSQWFVVWGDPIDPNAPPPAPRTRREKLADWWDYSVRGRWFDARYAVGDWFVALGEKIRGY